MHPTLARQHYIAHSSIDMQRMRVMRPFLASQPQAYATSCQIALESLDSYKLLRRHAALRRNPKFQITAYQAYSNAVQLAAFLLVEPSAPRSLRQDIELVMEDLDANTLGHTVAMNGSKILGKMLQLYDHIGVTAITPEAIAPEIAPVFGGESTARSYLRRCDIDYLLNRSRAGAADAGVRQSRAVSVAPLDLVDFDMSLDMLGVEEWDTLLQRMNFTA